ncbi:dienelactone hydrolase family protein, partial [Salmonella enterica]
LAIAPELYFREGDPNDFADIPTLLSGLVAKVPDSQVLADTMQKFRTHVTNLWRRALRRRSQKDDTTWTKANKLAAAWLPRVRVLHPWPVERFTARHPRQEPGA